MPSHLEKSLAVKRGKEHLAAKGISYYGEGVNRYVILALLDARDMVKRNACLFGQLPERHAARFAEFGYAVANFPPCLRFHFFCCQCK